MPFSHLHVHSQFSLLNGVNTPKELAKATKERGLDALAITDTCNLYGAVELTKACKEYGLHATLGAQLWVDPRGIGAREGKLLEEAYQLVLLVEDKRGYENLCALITRGIFDGIYYRPRVDLDLLRQHHEGLIALTSGWLGPIRRGGGEANRQRIAPLGELFGPERLFCALVDQGVEGQRAHVEEVRAFAAASGLQTVVTNEVRYVDARDVVVLDTLNCIAHGSSLDDPKRARQRTDQAYLKSEAEMRAIFPDDGPALDRAHEIAHRTHYKYASNIYYFPASTPPDPEAEADSQANWEFFLQAFPPPRDFGFQPGEVPPKPDGAGSLNGYFCWYSREGLKLRLRRIEEDKHPEYWERLERELKMIIKMGFAAYLLIVAEFINWGKDHEIPVGPGRGSAAGSLVAYAMRITDIDPVRFVLLFERFLNPERVSMPDIDVDFAQDRREEVIDHVRVKYGQPLVSQIITYGKLQAKAALKDVARTLDLTFQDSDRISKLIPAQLNITLSEALKQEEKLRKLCETDPRVRRVMAVAMQVEGITRQTGVHAAGVVIADRPLVQLAPLYRDGPEGGPVVQYDMKSAESIGLIKFDFLGLKTLDQIRDAVAMVERNTGEHIDMSAIPVEDLPTWKMLQRGDALGVFQVESSGMRDLLTRLKPSCLDDLVALVALYRPGPLSSGMVDDFIDRKHGRKVVEYPFPILADILGSTYGTIVYQEQVMQVAQVLAGYSLGEADMLRRAMGKKNPEEMAKQKGRFVGGAVKAGYEEQKVSDLFDLLAKFAEYGFNKSHSAAYGYVAYQTAWVKAHHRAEHMASLMTMDAGDSDKVLAYLGDCKRAGLKILPPDINLSQRAFDVPRTDRKTIRYGFCAVKGMGDNAIFAILEAREAAGGAFSDVMDFFARVDFRKVNRKVLETLIKCGAFDSFGEPRAKLFKGLEGAISAAQAEQERKASSQVSLFGGITATATFRFPNEPEWPVAERMKNEKETLGLFLTGHPMEDYQSLFDRLGVTTTDRLPAMEKDREVQIAGSVATKKEIKTQKGDKMAFLTLEDMHGSVEVVFFPRTYAKVQAVLMSGDPLVIKGKVDHKKPEETSVLADTADSLDRIREQSTSRVEFLLPADAVQPERVEKLKELIGKNPGRCGCAVLVEEPGNYRARVRLPPTMKVVASGSLKRGVEELGGKVIFL